MKKGLGRGLSALLDYSATNAESEGQEFSQESASNGVTQIDIRLIEPNRQQPRQYFDQEALAELAESIQTFGIIQPLIVKDCGGHYAIIAGERRFRAARLAKLETVPAIVKDYSEMETLQIALIENIQRQDLTPIEEASCYKRLVEDFFFTQEDIAQKIGKNRTAVSNIVRLLDLDNRVQELVSVGKLTASHARVLLQIRDVETQYACAEQIAEEGLSVRDTEKLVTSLSKAETRQTDEKKPADQTEQAVYRKVEDELKSLLGAKVNIHPGKKRGKIEIEYYSTEELDRLLCLFKRLPSADAF